MIAGIFEAMPTSGQKTSYLDIAASLRADLEAIDGFISVERYESLTTPGKLLSLSFFRDEAAIAEWRNRPKHRGAQTAGRDGVFSDYRVRIATVMRDYGLNDSAEAPPDSRAVHAE